MSKKKNKKNPWNTPSQSSGSEPEIIRTETGGSSTEERDDEKLREVLEKKVAEALKEGCVLDQLVDGLAVMKGEEREKMMQRYEETVPREVRDKMVDIVAGKATIEKLVDERRFEKERKKKVRLIKEGIRRKFFQQGSGPGDILNFGMYEGWRFGDVYICHPTYGEWAVEQAKPKMWKLKCFKFFLNRLADLDRLLQQEESSEQVNITRVEMCEGLMEEMAAEEQQAVEECKKVGKQRIKWADMEESQIEEDEKKRPERSQEDSGTSVEKWVSYDMAVEEHEAVMQREEEMIEAGLAEMNRDKTRDLVQEKDREFKQEEWDWESAIEEDGSTREAFEPRESKGRECQKDGEEKTGKGGRDERNKGEKTEKGGRDEREKGGKERHEEGGKERQEEGGKEGQDKGEEGKEASRWQDDRHERQDEGGNEVIRRQDDGQDEKGNKGFRWQDDDDEDDKKQVEKQGNVVRRQLEGDMRQDEDGKGRATDIWEKDEGEKRRELGKGGQRVNLEDFFRRYKQAQGEQQQQQQGGRDRSEWESFSCRGPQHFESRGKDGGCEQRQEDERERLKRGIGQGKGMRKGQGKGKGEIDEQNWEESWRVKKENWMNEQWGRMSEDDLGMGQTGERLRQEQWEAVRTLKLRNEMLRMAECLGEEMASELGRS